MSKEFASYEEAKQHYDAMVKDDEAYRNLTREVRRVEGALNNKLVSRVPKIKEELEEELGVYTRVRKNLEDTLKEKYGVENIRQLSNEIKEFKKGLELLKETEGKTSQDNPGTKGNQPGKWVEPPKHSTPEHHVAEDGQNRYIVRQQLGSNTQENQGRKNEFRRKLHELKSEHSETLEAKGKEQDQDTNHERYGHEK